jgi:hypothetical protein
MVGYCHIPAVRDANFEELGKVALGYIYLD